MIKYIIKRNGNTVSFDPTRISKAIFKAAQAVGGSDAKISLKLTEKVAQTIQENYENKTPTVEEIQDIVEKVLIDEGHAKTAKAYILYRADKTKRKLWTSRTCKRGHIIHLGNTIVKIKAYFVLLSFSAKAKPMATLIQKY